MSSPKNEDRERTLEFIESRKRGIDHALSLTKKWTCKRRDKARLFREIACDFVVIGINHYLLGDIQELRRNFRLAIESLAASARLSPVQEPGYSDIQVLSGGLLAGCEEQVNQLSNLLIQTFRPSFERNSNLSENDYQSLRNGRYTALSFVAWIASIPTDETIEYARKGALTGPPLEQFGMWAKCVEAAAVRDDGALQSNIDALARFSDRQRIRGEFA